MTMSPLPSDPVSEGPVAHRRSQREAPPGPSLGALLGSRTGHLALAVLVVELLAGMQVYLNQTVLPLPATEMGARNAHGLVTAAAQVPAFLTMPLGGAMLTRWRPARLMTVLTTLLLSGAVVGALAPNIEFYVLGEILRGLAAGALATATMGVMVTGLPDAWRRLCLAVGRRAGIATLMWVCAFFRTLDYLVAPSAHDVLDMIPTQIGWALTAGGIGWSVVALVCGAHPAGEPKAYRRRTTLAAAFFVLGAALMTTTVLGRPGWWGLPVGYGVAGIGMGLTHLDTMNRIVTDPAEPDGITHVQAATAVTIAGAAGGAVLGTVTTAFVAPTASGVETDRLWPTLILLAVGLLLTPLLARRAA